MRAKTVKELSVHPNQHPQPLLEALLSRRHTLMGLLMDFQGCFPNLQQFSFGLQQPVELLTAPSTPIEPHLALAGLLGGSGLEVPHHASPKPTI